MERYLLGVMAFNPFFLIFELLTLSFFFVAPVQLGFLGLVLFLERRHLGLVFLFDFFLFLLGPGQFFVVFDLLPDSC